LRPSYPKGAQWAYPVRLVYQSGLGSKLAQNVTLSSPDGDGARVQLTNRSIAIFMNKYPIQFLRNGGNIYTFQALLGHTTLDMVKRYLAIAQIDIDSDHEKASPVKVWKL
jgi:hypothetical protein